MSEIISALNWRYAVQSFDTTKKIRESDFNELLEVLRLSPSSFGLQPWKFIVVENPELRKKIQEAAFGQPKVTEASHLIVVCAKLDVTEEYIREFIHDTSKARNIPFDSLKGLHDMMLNFRKGFSKEMITEWAKRQSYIALGMLLEAAALKKIDAGPMEGFNPKQVDEILDLHKQGYTTAALCALGYRSNDDKYASMAKVRHPHHKIIERR